MTQTPIDVCRIAGDYYYAWTNGDWSKLRALLAPNVVFESPRHGRIVGADEHMRLYTERRRFPDLRHLAPGPSANAPDLAIWSYEVYLAVEQRRFTVFDQVHVSDLKVDYVLSIMEAWPD
jgi:hypothetical protein